MMNKDMISYQVHYRDLVDSTNRWAKDLAKAGMPEGTVCVADSQTAGKGRRGRTWISPKGESIYMSLILRPQILPEQACLHALVKNFNIYCFHFHTTIQ